VRMDGNLVLIDGDVCIFAEISRVEDLSAATPQTSRVDQRLGNGIVECLDPGQRPYSPSTPRSHSPVQVVREE
jgi:hypothetical protein